MKIDKTELINHINTMGPRGLLGHMGIPFQSGSRNGGMICCPWHDDSNPSCSISEGDHGDVVAKCFTCNESGDAIHFVSRVIGAEDKPFPRKLEAVAAAVGMRPGKEWDGHVRKAPEAMPQPREYPPEVEMASLWRPADGPVDGVKEVLPAYADLPESMFGVLSGSAAREAKAPSWPWRENFILVKAYNARGEWKGLHGRDLRKVPDTKIKSRWPLGYDAKGLFMADAAGVEFLKGRQAERNVVFITEGLTDTCSQAAYIARRNREGSWKSTAGWNHLVIGGGNSSLNCLSEIRWPKRNIKIAVLVDDDEAGRAYFDQIMAGLPARIRGAVRRPDLRMIPSAREKYNNERK